MLNELSIQALSKKLNSKEEKIVECLSGYKSISEKFSPYNPFLLDPEDIRDKLFSDPTCLDTFNSLVMPLESKNWNQGQVVLDDPPRALDTEKNKWINNALSGQAIAAVDASYIRHDVHSNLLYSYMQVGVFWKTIGRYHERVVGDLKIGDELYSSDKNLKLFEDENYQKWNWDLTVNILKEYFAEYSPFLFFLDESLSISYARNYTRDRQTYLLTSLLQYLKQIDDLDIIPVAIYHSLDRGIVNTGLKCSACEESGGCKNCGIKPSSNEILFRTFYDKLFLQRILVDNYSRTPYFRPLNSIIARACNDVVLNLAAFYLRVNDSILRVEFPYKYAEEDRNVVSKIHRAVVADSLYTGGYPVALMNAHELAVLSSQDRSTVNELVYRKTLDMTKKYGVNLSVKFTRKSELKRRRLI